MLVSFVYIVACRLFTLVLLLARSDRSKDELLVLRHGCRSCGGKLGARSWRRATGCYWQR